MSSAYSRRSSSVRRAARLLGVVDRLELVVEDGVDRGVGAPSPAIEAVGSAMQASGSKAGPAIAYKPGAVRPCGR